MTRDDAQKIRIRVFSEIQTDIDTMDRSEKLPYCIDQILRVWNESGVVEDQEDARCSLIEKCTRIARYAEIVIAEMVS